MGLDIQCHRRRVFIRLLYTYWTCESQQGLVWIWKVDVNWPLLAPCPILTLLYYLSTVPVPTTEGV